MPTTNIEGPHSNTGAGTIDGVSFTAWSNASRLHETSTGTNVVVTSTAGAVLGSRWFNCFNDNQIPAGAIITGMEIVATTDFDGSGTANFGCFGSSGASADIVAKIYLHNGTDYSSALTLDNSVATSGVSFNGDNTEVTIRGSNRRYLGLSAVGTLAGSSTSLSGLTFDTANQADFGFAIVFTTVDSGAVAGILRGIGLRATYREGAIAEKINTAISGSVVRLDTIAGNVIKKFNGLLFTGATPPGAFSKTYQFEDQTTQETAGLDWSPSNTHSDWVNGTSAVDGAKWNRNSDNKTTKGWNCGQDGTGSSGTGPNGGVDPSDGSHDTSSDGDRYLFSECSGQNTKAFITRMPGFNFSTEMLNTGADLNLKFWVHAYGSNMGDLYVYIDTNATSNHATATELAAYESFSGYTANSSVWQQKTISLNSYRTTDAIHYIYFLTQNGTSFRSDMAIDGIQIIEG